MYPVVVTFDGDTGDVGVFEWLQGCYGFGEGSGQDLTDMEQIAADQNKVDFHLDGISNDSGQAAKEIFVTLGSIGTDTIGFTKMDVGGVNETHGRVLTRSRMMSEAWENEPKEQGDHANGTLHTYCAVINALICGNRTFGNKGLQTKPSAPALSVIKDNSSGALADIISTEIRLLLARDFRC